MPLQNRVTPFGDIVAHSARGRLMGNRGILHNERRRLGVGRWKHKNWIVCVLTFRGRHRDVMTPRRYTELFFLDEAVALAAGHRPCAECRQVAYRRFIEAFAHSAWPHDQPPRAAQVDRVLHDARVHPRSRQQIRHEAPLRELPSGAFVELPDEPGRAYLLLDGRLFPWTPEGYGPPVDRPADAVIVVLTPAPTVAALRAGYRPLLHASIGR